MWAFSRPKPCKIGNILEVSVAGLMAKGGSGKWAESLPGVTLEPEFPGRTQRGGEAPTGLVPMLL